MTTAGEPPPLPPDDDPFALLGIAQDATDKDIRKAYARRIKVYRPDRAPTEFQRIHRAFEMLTAGRAMEIVRPAVSEPPAEAEPPPPAEDASKVISAAFVDIQAAALRGDSAEVDRLIGALLDRQVPLDELFADPDNHDLLLRSPAITWKRLGDRDRPGRWAVWNQAFDRAYAGDPARAAKLLDDDELRHAAADDPSVAIMVLDRLASLAWRGVDTVGELLDSYGAYLPMHGVVEHRANAVLLHREAHAELSKLAELPPVLAMLPDVFQRTTIGTHEQERAAAAALRDALAADIPATLAQLDTWAKAHQHGAQLAVRELIVHSLSGHRCRLDVMPKRRFDALTEQLHRAGKSPWTPKTSSLLASALMATIFTLPYGLLIPVAVGGYFVGTETARYRREIAPAVARALLEVPVLSTVVERWVKINPKLRGRLGRFDIGLENDWGLYLFSLLLAYATEVGGLDPHLDEE